MRRAGSARPDATSAARTRSFASDTALSGSPTIFLVGCECQKNKATALRNIWHRGRGRATPASETTTLVKPAKAYSYLRFSTPEQLKGDSQRRQLEAARA